MWLKSHLVAALSLRPSGLTTPSKGVDVSLAGPRLGAPAPWKPPELAGKRSRRQRRRPVPLLRWQPQSSPRRAPERHPAPVGDDQHPPRDRGEGLLEAGPVLPARASWRLLDLGHERQVMPVRTHRWQTLRGQAAALRRQPKTKLKSEPPLQTRLSPSQGKNPLTNGSCRPASVRPSDGHVGGLRQQGANHRLRRPPNGLLEEMHVANDHRVRHRLQRRRLGEKAEAQVLMRAGRLPQKLRLPSLQETETNAGLQRRPLLLQPLEQVQTTQTQIAHRPGRARRREPAGSPLAGPSMGRSSRPARRIRSVRRRKTARPATRRAPETELAEEKVAAAPDAVAVARVATAGSAELRGGAAVRARGIMGPDVP